MPTPVTEPRSSRVAIIFLSVTIGLFFCLMGMLKLSPNVNDEIYRMMRKTFIKFVKVFPLAKYTGYRPSPHIWRKACGSAEVLCGLILAIVPGTIKEVANVVLLAVSLLNAYCGYMLDEQLDKMTPSIVFSLLLTCRLVIVTQLRNAAKRRQEAAAVVAEEDEEEEEEVVVDSAQKKSQ